jgi:fumarate reductase flavoprotein subunit
VSDQLNFDVVCVGGGLAGLVAGCRAAELGFRVAVLEQGDGNQYPCNSRFSGGVFHVSYHDVMLGREELTAAMTRATNGQADPALVDTVAENAGRLVEWLRAQGARFMRGGTASWFNWVLAPPRPPSTGMDWVGRGPDVLLRTLTQRLVSGGGKIFLCTRAQSLEMEAGRCTGVVVCREGGEAVRFGAHAVVLADGGFQGNADLFRRHIGPRPDLVLQRGAGTARGDGLLMAQEAGAGMTGLNRFYGHLLSRDALQNDQLWPYPQIDAISSAALVVDSSGSRFVDEGLGGIHLSNCLAGLPDPTCATVILDSAIWEGPGRGAQIPPNPTLERAGGTIHRSNSLAELAEAAQLPADALSKTVDSYNAAIEAGTAMGLTPARSAKHGKPWPIRQLPVMAIPICVGITNTMGGILIDGVGRVLRPDRSIIGGLYAAGATTGGLEGGAEVGYVGGLVKTGVFALRAAEHIASELQARAA